MLAIATPNTDRSLLTLDERKAALGIAVSDTSKDTQLTALGGYVDATITRACNVSVAADIPPTLRLETVTEIFRLKESVDRVFMSRCPVAVIVSVMEGGIELVADTDYEIDGQTIYRLVNGVRTCWALAPSTIVVEYSGGWDVVPEDLKYASIKFTQAEWNGGGAPRDPWLKSVTIEGVGSRDYWVDPTSAASVCPAAVMDILERGGYVNQRGWVQ
jgi:hypothetical protein